MTSEEWGKLRLMVHIRDLEVVKAMMKTSGISLMGANLENWPCPAVVMDPTQLRSCYGEWKLDHVKDEPRLAVKADDDEDHLIALCAAHDERGAKGGSVWNTSHREEERAYLRQRRADRLAAMAADESKPLDAAEASGGDAHLPGDAEADD